jgi:hypothetical protein
MAYVSCATLDAKLADVGNVIPGTNVTITGDGSEATPYVINVPTADTSVKGAVALATAADYPNPTNDVDAATPAYVDLAIKSASPVDSTGAPIEGGDCVLRCPASAGAPGQQLTLQADGSTVWANPVTTDATLTGAGTPASPLSVASTPMLKCGNWEISCDTAGNLVFLNGGTRVAKIEPNGHITSANDISAFCTV